MSRKREAAEREDLVMTLLLFGEYLDEQNLILSHEQSRDGRSYDELARTFLADLEQRRAV